jgi:hypothetical protein
MVAMYIIMFTSSAADPTHGITSNDIHIDISIATKSVISEAVPASRGSLPPSKKFCSSTFDIQYEEHHRRGTKVFTVCCT